MRTKSIARTLAGVATLTFSVAHGQEPTPPEYLLHRGDPVQKAYSSALLGMQFESKCHVLNAERSSHFDAAFRRATELFQGYVLAMRFVADPAHALEFPREMATGARHFVDAAVCDAKARSRIEEGYEQASAVETTIRKMSASD